MPTRKQRKRRQKEHRHDYEYVLLDDEGQEVPVDPADLRQAKKEKTDQKDRSKPAPAPKDRRGRPMREVKPPSWRRAFNRAAIFVVALLVFTSLVGKNKPSIAARLVIAFGYGIIGVPLFYVMDRAAYRRYLRATGRAETPPPAKRNP
jgi:hypothetical protein